MNFTLYLLSKNICSYKTINFKERPVNYNVKRDYLINMAKLHKGPSKSDFIILSKRCLDYIFAVIEPGLLLKYSYNLP